MTDRYAVIGNPIAHSKSPRIHAAFAAQTGQDMQYDALLGRLDGFAETVRDFARNGGRGLNVTIPFKLEAHALAHERSARAEAARAVNTLVFEQGRIIGDNTDGAGLVQDLTHNLGLTLKGARILLLGAGGAARGVIFPLLQLAPTSLCIANRTVARAQELQHEFAPRATSMGHNCTLIGCGFDDLAGQSFDVVINATAASLSDDAPPLPAGLYAPHAAAYDMVYGKGRTPFLQQAVADGAEILADGLGMLVEQAAEAFTLWRGVRPNTAPVLQTLRAELSVS